MSTNRRRLTTKRITKEQQRNFKLKSPVRLMYFQDIEDDTFGAFPLPLSLRKFDPEVTVIEEQKQNPVLHAILINQLVERASYFERLWYSSLSTVLS